MGFGVALSLAIGLLVAGANSTNENASSKYAPLDGAWRLVSGEADGEALPESHIQGGVLNIHGADYTITLPEVGTLKGTQKLGEANGFKTIDIVDEGGPLHGKTCLGIYELRDDEFRVVFALPGEARPTSFDTKPDSGQWMHVWKRIQK